MSGIGIDPGSSRASLGRCDLEDGIESIAVESRGDLLPSAAIRDDDAFTISLETAFPLVPLGVGGIWPPEAQSSPLVGARRLPLALALATLERPSQTHSAARGPAKWGWPRTARFEEAPVGQELVATLMRRAIGRFADDRSVPLALAVPNTLPLFEQTLLLGRLGRNVRLIWRCMAAGLHRAQLQSQGSGRAAGLPIGPGARVLHVHLGLDGFEATRFSYARHQTEVGPELLVPSRSRPRADRCVSVTRPFLGLQLCGHVHWTHTPDTDALWTSMFASPSPLKAAKPGIVRSRQPDIVAGDQRAGWPNVLKGALWQRQHAEAEIAAWIDQVRPLIGAGGDDRPHLVLLTGDFAHAEDTSEVDELLSRPAKMVWALAQGAKLPVERLAPGAIAMGAALYASRRARRWATYLDELPPVEIVVQSSDGARWKHLLTEPHYDAGAPVEVRLDNFSLNPGERQLLLPVYVHEFGEDTPDVLATKVEFKHATAARTAAEVVVEVEAATGLPVVRATVGGAVNESAEVDWANDRESARTSKTKSEYLDGLPRAFPPIEERVAGDWWVKGGRFRVARVPLLGNGDWTGEQLAERLPQLYAGSTARFAECLDAFLKLAKKRELKPDRARLIAATSAEGVNPDSRCLNDAMKLLLRSVLREWSGQTISNKSGNALAALCCREKAWIDHLLGESAAIQRVNENDYRIAGLGSCVFEEADMARAVGALALRLHTKLSAAAQSGGQPVGNGTLTALGNLLSLRADALRGISDWRANQLAEDVSHFIARTLAGGGFKTKFQSCLRTMVYLTRRRKYQADFLSADSQAFKRIVRSCARVYIATRLETSRSNAAILDAVKRDLKELKRESRARNGRATDATCAIIDSVDMSDLKFANNQYPSNPAKLLELLVQVIEYIEGRGTGILVIDESDDGDGDDDGGGATNGGGAGGNSDGGEGG
jgi:hypothetical protein